MIFRESEESESDGLISETIYMKADRLRRKRAFYLRMTVMLALINLVLIISSFGQMVTVNNVGITNSAQITVKGDMLHNTGSTVNNTGSINLTGDFTNNSGSNLFGSSAGNVNMNGVNQVITGANPTMFNNLTLSGTGTKTLQQDISVGGNYATPSGVLSLSDRQLELDAHIITITNGIPAAVTRTTGYIISETGPVPGYGIMKWQTGVNTGVYEFPFGNAVSNTYVPVIVDINTPGTGANGSLNLATYPTNTVASPNNRPLPNGLGSLVDNLGTENATHVVDRWWMLEAADYTTKPVSDITFKYRESEWNATAGSTNIINEPTLKAQSHNGSVWTPVPTGIVNTGLNTVTVFGVNIYNPVWTLVSSDNPLPIELLTFDAKLNSDLHVELNWATATEINNDYFTIEKSRDGVHFENLMNVDGAGNSNNVLYYHEKDKQPFDGITYYRLKQTDFDGQFSYSDIRAVKLEKSATTTFSVFPNPATDHFFVKFDEQSEAQRLFILDMNGKVVREIQLNEVEVIGTGLIKINRLSMEAGMYFISTYEGKMQKLVLQ